MRITKSKVFVTSLVVSLVAILSMSTLAWFSDSDSVSNKFLVADSVDIDTPDEVFSIDVYEKYDGDGDGTPEEYQNGITYDKILPGAELGKLALVKNTGNYDQYVRVIITISDKSVWKDMVEDAGGDFTSYDVRDHFVGFDSSAWDLDNSTVSYDDVNDTIVYVVYYNAILAPNDEIEVFEGIKIPEIMTRDHAAALNADGEHGFTVDVRAQAVQTEYVGDSAFEAFDTVQMQIAD